MADTMRERIARAIENAEINSFPDGPYPDDYRRAADAVLDAMREPTEAMNRAMHTAHNIERGKQWRGAQNGGPMPVNALAINRAVYAALIDACGRDDPPLIDAAKEER